MTKKFPITTSAIILLLFIVGLISNNNSGLILISCLLALIGIGVLMSAIKQIKGIRKKHEYNKNASTKLIITLMAFFLITGTGLFVYVFHEISLLPSPRGQHFNNVEYFIRSLIYSINLFMLNVDGNVFDLLGDNVLLKSLISVQAALSFSCTVLMLAGLIFSRLYAYYILAYKTKITYNKNHLYIFFGVNDPSITLIKDIQRNDTAAVIILIDLANIDEDNNGDWSSLLGFMTHRKSTLKIVNELKIGMDIAAKRLGEFETGRQLLGSGASNDSICLFEHLGLSKTQKLIRDLGNSGQLSFFFLDDDEEQNVRDAMMLTKDKTFQESNGQIYCRSRYNGTNQILEEIAVKARRTIKMLNTPCMAIDSLKCNPMHHPYNTMDFEAAAATRPLNTLIIGFGNTGQEAFKFLYEFGSFVDKNNKRNGFNCYIVDKRLNSIAGSFKASMPGVFSNNLGIHFHNTDYNSEKCSTEVLSDENVRQLNYAVITIDNDDEAISLAVRIFNQFLRAGGDTNRLQIVVRCQHNDKIEAMQKVADYYNRGYSNNADAKPIIFIFGNPSSIFTYNHIIDDYILKRAKLFLNKYNRFTHNHNYEPWDNRRQRLLDHQDASLRIIRRLRRSEAQDLSIAAHMHTKLNILLQCLPPNTDLNFFYNRYFTKFGEPYVIGNCSCIKYPGLTPEENLIILRLAIMEHIRWTSAMELFGYTKPNDNNHDNDFRINDITRHNLYMVEWERLDYLRVSYDYKKYYFDVVDATIALGLQNE